MERRLVILASLLSLSAAASSVLRAADVSPAPAGRRQQRQEALPPSPAPHRAVLDKYCVGCHNQRQKTAGLMLDTLDVADVGGAAEIWEKVVRKLRSGAMPPPGMPRPDQATATAFASYLE